MAKNTGRSSLSNHGARVVLAETASGSNNWVGSEFHYQCRCICCSRCQKIPMMQMLTRMMECLDYLESGRATPL